MPFKPNFGAQASESEIFLQEKPAVELQVWLDFLGNLKRILYLRLKEKTHDLCTGTWLQFTLG